MDHYCCVLCYLPRIWTTRVCDTLTFLPHELPLPKVNLEDHLCQAADDLVTILTSPPSPQNPSLREEDQVQKELLDIATQLQRVEKLPQNQESAQETRVPGKQEQDHVQETRVHTTTGPQVKEVLQQNTTPQ